MGNFVILIGGPGLFKGCDKAHDQNWTNYIVPLQLAAQRNLYNRQSGETVHWVLYEPPYRKRWLDDSVITKQEKQESDGYHLHSVRKTAADRVLARRAGSYIHRIQIIAVTNGITYKGINNPDEFWNYLQSLGDDSITRVWYSGHASPDGLMLALFHDNACKPKALLTDMIRNIEISKRVDLRKKFHKTSKKMSKFYGCYTKGFALEWNKIFGVSAASAKAKIDFGVIDRPSSIVNIMKRIETTPTSEGNPDWTEYQ